MSFINLMPDIVWKADHTELY